MEKGRIKELLKIHVALFLRRLWNYLLLFPIVAVAGVILVTDRGVPPDCLAKQWEWLSVSGMIACGTLVLIALFLPKKLNRLPRFVIWTLILLGGVEAVYGLLQIFGVLESNHSLFALTGTFYNPGPYSGYLAMVLPLAIDEVMRHYRRKKMAYYAALVVVALILCVLPAGMSRAAWLAAGASSLYVLDRWYGWHTCLGAIQKRGIMILLTGLITLAAAVGGMYLMKKDSADGRLLIWRVALNEALKSPFEIQDGDVNFSAVYGEAQEDYFSEHGYTESEERIAGTPDFAFNEYIQMFLMGGVIALTLMVCVIGSAFYFSCKRSNGGGTSGALLSASIFAFFSYPFHIPAFVAAFALLVFISFVDYFRYLHKQSNPFVRLGWIISVVIISIVSRSVYIKNASESRDISRWVQVRLLYHSGAYAAAAASYQELTGMFRNADFRFEYGRSLYKIGKYKEAKEVLDYTLKHYSGDPMILNLLGQVAQAMGDYVEAEEYFLRSTCRLPGRIYPYYLLVRLYADPEYYHPKRLREIAEIVLTKEPKVHSTAIEQMKKEVEKILEKFKTVS